MTDHVQVVAPEARPPDAPTEGEALVASTTTTLRAAAGFVKLYDPDHEHLYYGPYGQHDYPPNDVAGNIEIGVVEPHVAVVPRDHPLIERFLSDHDHAISVEPGESPGEGRAYLCELDDREFSTKAALAAHRRGVHHMSAPTSPRPATAPRPAVARRRTKAKARSRPTTAK